MTFESIEWPDEATEDRAVNREQHDPTVECNGVHCYSHMVDEWYPTIYIACLECGHAYHTKWSLWRAYQRAKWSMARSAWRARPRRWRALRGPVDPWGPPLGDNPIGITWDAVLTLSRRPSKIYFCQECVHDF